MNHFKKKKTGTFKVHHRVKLLQRSKTNATMFSYMCECISIKIFVNFEVENYFKAINTILKNIQSCKKISESVFKMNGAVNAVWCSVSEHMVPCSDFI